jgi:uncharacterized membrane protein YagU involved in acid resistance
VLQPKRIVAGAISGAVATVVMTGWMVAGDATGPYGEQPPKRLVRRLARCAGVPAGRRGAGTRLATAVAHLGFGAGSGALYAAVVPRSSVPRGAAFGLGVWAASYLGWIPALGLLPPPHRDNPRRAWTMATAHLVYGAVLGRVVEDRAPAAGH